MRQIKMVTVLGVSFQSFKVWMTGSNSCPQGEDRELEVLVGV